MLTKKIFGTDMNKELVPKHILTTDEVPFSYSPDKVFVTQKKKNSQKSDSNAISQSATF